MYNKLTTILYVAFLQCTIMIGIHDAEFSNLFLLTKFSATEGNLDYPYSFPYLISYTRSPFVCLLVERRANMLPSGPFWTCLEMVEQTGFPPCRGEVYRVQRGKKKNIYIYMFYVSEPLCLCGGR